MSATDASNPAAAPALVKGAARKSAKRLVEFAPGLMLPKGFKSYQDVWLKGQVIHDGKRTCARRYKLIHDALAERYRPGFTTLDIGASEGYFSIRLAEDLRARPTMLEKKSELKAIVQAQENPSMKVVSGRFDKSTLAKLGAFDVVIALSIVHHFPNWGAMIKRILAMGDTVIIELPAENERSTKRATSAAGMMEVLQWYNPVLIGETAGYAEEAKRQLYVVDFPAAPVGKYVIQGKVGGGRASSARQHRHYRPAIKRQTGITVVPGTLNLRLAQRFHFKNSIKVESEKGMYHLFPCRIEGISAFVMKPPRAKNRSNTLEIVAPYKLREVFDLVDDSVVMVELDSAYVGTKKEIEYVMKSATPTVAETTQATQEHPREA